MEEETKSLNIDGHAVYYEDYEDLRYWTTKFKEEDRAEDFREAHRDGKALIRLSQERGYAELIYDSGKGTYFFKKA